MEARGAGHQFRQERNERPPAARAAVPFDPMQAKMVHHEEIARAEGRERVSHAEEAPSTEGAEKFQPFVPAHGHQRLPTGELMGLDEQGKRRVELQGVAALGIEAVPYLKGLKRDIGWERGRMHAI